MARVVDADAHVIEGRELMTALIEEGAADLDARAFDSG